MHYNLLFLQIHSEQVCQFELLHFATVSRTDNRKSHLDMHRKFSVLLDVTFHYRLRKTGST
jgi:hypothetical protein